VVLKVLRTEPQGSARETSGLRELFVCLCFIFRNLLWGSVNHGQSRHGLHNTKNLRTPGVQDPDFGVQSGRILGIFWIWIGYRFLFNRIRNRIIQMKEIVTIEKRELD